MQKNASPKKYLQLHAQFKTTHRLPNIWLSYLVVTQALSPWSSKKEGGKDDAAAVAFRSKNFSCKTFRTKERN